MATHRRAPRPYRGGRRVTVTRPTSERPVPAPGEPGGPGHVGIDLAFNPNQKRDAYGRWAKTTTVLPATAVDPFWIPDGFRAKLAEKEDEAALVRAGWEHRQDRVWKSREGHTVSFPDGVEPLVQAYFARKVAGALKISRRASTTIDEKPVRVRVPPMDVWRREMAAINPQNTEGEVVGYVASDNMDTVHINPLLLLHSASAVGKPLPALEGVSTAQATLVHELGHVVMFREGREIDVLSSPLVSMGTGALSTYADVNPREQYAEAWSEWVYGNAKGRKSDYAFATASVFADRYGWGWTE